MPGKAGIIISLVSVPLFRRGGLGKEPLQTLRDLRRLPFYNRDFPGFSMLFAGTSFFRRLLKVLFMMSDVFGRGGIAVKFDSFVDYFGNFFAVFVGQKQFFVFFVG